MGFTIGFAGLIAALVFACFWKSACNDKEYYKKSRDEYSDYWQKARVELETWQKSNFDYAAKYNILLNRVKAIVDAETPK